MCWNIAVYYKFVYRRERVYLILVNLILYKAYESNSLKKYKKSFHLAIDIKWLYTMKIMIFQW